MTSLPSGLAIALGYYLRHAANPRLAEGWNWTWWSVAMALAALVIGACWAAGASWGVRWSEQREHGAARTLALGGLLGGTLGGLIPMTICVGGFGALHAPYAGTGLVTFPLLLSFVGFVLLHPLAPPAPAPAPNAVARGLAAVLVLAPFGLALMAMLTLVFPWSTIVVIRDELMLRYEHPFALVAIGSLLSAPFLGGTLGLLLGLVTSLSRIFARAWGRFDALSSR